MVNKDKIIDKEVSTWLWKRVNKGCFLSYPSNSIVKMNKYQNKLFIYKKIFKKVHENISNSMAFPFLFVVFCGFKVNGPIDFIEDQTLKRLRLKKESVHPSWVNFLLTS